MKLYFSPGACSLAPHIIVRETNQTIDLVRVDTKTHTTQSGEDYYTINPKGSVPLLELDNGERLSEGPIIAQYLADKVNAQSLMPAAGTMERYRVMEWQNYITSELHKSYAVLFAGAIDESSKDYFRAGLRKKLSWVSECLKGKAYLTGDDFTAADAYLFTVASWSKLVKVDLSGLDTLAEYLRRVAARPAVRAAMKAESLGNTSET